ncbi:hypothetical protein FKR81_02935 [Lentzea tibetensis]|uniref:Peptidase inhibitor family I36 n=1 Tax=Lentzea tibetensis TaxID=2591470 RepID=A0A563F1W6_9PSEU|nr:peptidase inhibitor family I36 protein [Lentzea tibetensis]TWP53728.1 hypothetical protein FKR81_02935 [Lentzea tibetensis]
MKFTKLAVGTAVVGAVVLGGIGVASADIGIQAEACTPDRVCIYKDNNFIGRFGVREPLKPTYTVSSTFDNLMSSWRNLTNVDARWYHDGGGRGRCVTMNAGTSDNDISVRDDNKLSSWNTQGRC